MASEGTSVGGGVTVADGAGVAGVEDVAVAVGGLGVDRGVATGNCVIRGAQAEETITKRQTSPAVILASIASPRLVGQNKHMPLYKN